jgi:DNA-binding NarL/FixJ family response regulator
MNDREKILVVDGDEKWLSEIKTILEPGYDLTLLTDSSKAEGVLRKDEYDLVIIDLSLPTTLGTEMLERIREISANTRVIVLTSHSELFSQAKELGAFEYISKRAISKEVLRAVKLAIGDEQLELKEPKSGNHIDSDSKSEIAIEVSKEIRTLFQASMEEIFEEGMESEFSKEFVSIVKRHGAQAIIFLRHMIFSGSVNEELASEALRWLGRLDDPLTYNNRLHLLEEALSHPSARIRDAASLGLAALDDLHALPYLKQAIEQEIYVELREDMAQVVAQLESLR